MTRYALSQLRQGREVYANYVINHPKAHLITVADLKADRMEQLAMKRGSLVCISEAGVYFNSRMSMLNFDASDFLIFMQGRKVGLEFWWDAQRIGSVDVYLRELSSQIWCMTYAASPFNAMKPLAFQAFGYRRHLLEDVWEPAGHRWVFPRRKIYAAYDTTATVDVPEKYLRARESREAKAAAQASRRGAKAAAAEVTS